MTKISKEERFAVYALVVLVLIGGYVYWSYLPKEKEFDRLIQDRNNKEVQLRRMPIQEKNQEQLTKALDDMGNKLTSVKMQLPKEKEIPDLLKNIDSKGRESNIDFLYFKPQPIIAKEFYGEVPIILNVKGKFHNVVLFLNKLAGLSRLISVSNIRIFNVSENDENVTIKAEMVAKSYIYIERK
ncbi:MAG: type 4a pilus biogenesis protein PilO [bacterium]